MDTRYLEKRGNVWWVTIYVPRGLREKLPKKLTATLRTDSLKKAQRDRWRHVEEFNRRIEAAQGGADRATARTTAIEFRDLLKAAAKHGNAKDDETPTPLDALEAALMATEEGLEEEHGRDAAGQFHLIATGKLTPMRDYLERWLTASPFTTRTKAEHRTAIMRLEKWAEASGHGMALESFTGRNASAFRDTELMGRCALQAKTANKIMSSLRTYWAWAIESELVTGDNPWKGKSLGKRRAAVTATERPFTDDELRTLLGEIADEDLQDFMRIAALSGMRIEEIASLTVGQCAGGLFQVGNSKTDSGTGRVIPIHSALLATVERRTKGKPANAFLLLEATRAGWDGNRSMAISKRFTRQRRALGIEEKQEGQRRSQVNFHSFRRWFLKAALEGEKGNQWILADIVGHKIGELPFDLTMRRYPGASTLEKRRAVIESIQLPRGAAPKQAGK